MATELKTNGTAAEYSPKKRETLLNGNGEDMAKNEKYTKRNIDGDEERIPLRGAGDVEQGAPVAALEEDDQDTRDSVSTKRSPKKKSNKKLMDEDDDDDDVKKEKGNGPLKGTNFESRYQYI